jgi:hypothetical protein
LIVRLGAIDLEMPGGGSVLGGGEMAPQPPGGAIMTAPMPAGAPGAIALPPGALPPGALPPGATLMPPAAPGNVVLDAPVPAAAPAPAPAGERRARCAGACACARPGSSPGRDYGPDPPTPRRRHTPDPQALIQAGGPQLSRVDLAPERGPPHLDPDG